MNIEQISFCQQTDQFWAKHGSAPKHNHRAIRAVRRKQQKKARQIQQNRNRA